MEKYIVRKGSQQAYGRVSEILEDGVFDVYCFDRGLMKAVLKCLRRWEDTCDLTVGLLVLLDITKPCQHKLTTS